MLFIIYGANEITLNADDVVGRIIFSATSSCKMTSAWDAVNGMEQCVQVPRPGQHADARGDAAAPRVPSLFMQLDGTHSLGVRFSSRMRNKL